MAGASEILNVAQVAAFLRCSKAHVCKAIRGQVRGVTPLPAISMGRRKLVRRQSLEEWLAQNEPATETPEASEEIHATTISKAKNQEPGRLLDCPVSGPRRPEAEGFPGSPVS